MGDLCLRHLACLGLDFALAMATISEGTQYLAAVLQHVPGFFALWGAAWAGWHVSIIQLWVKLIGSANHQLQ